MLGSCLLRSPELRAQGVKPQAIEKIMSDALQSWNVPGAALAIVHENKVVFLKGFGVRKLGQPGRVTADTVFPIASCTKAFTTLAMAMLVDEGKMAWDDPVRKHVDFFHLADPLADANVTLRDLVTHRTGVSGHELLWYRAPWGMEERIRKIGHVELTRSFRSVFQYQSILFGTAGYAAGKASGGTWADLVKKRVLEPLDMKATTLAAPASWPTGDQASPHRRGRNEKVEAMPPYLLADPDPAGSIHSSARDLARFVAFQLGDGAGPRGQRLVSAVNLAETHSPQMVIRREGFAKIMNPDTLQISYGMGWIVQDYRGRLLLLHGGAIDGFRAHFTLVPKTRLGIVLLNNLDSTQMNLAVSNTLVDLFLGHPYKDWNAYYLDIQQTEDAQKEARARALRKSRHPDTKTSLPLAAYAGDYAEAAYGSARVSLDNGKLVLHWGAFHWPLEHFHYDTFLANDDVLVDAPVSFRLGTSGDVTVMKALGRKFSRKR
jgi:CubicO group peptidase (beta-lactamase class C family)